SRRRRLRGYPHRAHQARAGGGHVGLAVAVPGHAIDGLEPRGVTSAQSESEVVEAIRTANDRGEAIVVAGGRTRLGIGDPPAGYDLTRLWSGTFGTLAAIVELTLKLTTAPERTVTLAGELDIATALTKAAAIHATGLPIDALAIVAGEAAQGLGARGEVMLLVR